MSKAKDDLEERGPENAAAVKQMVASVQPGMWMLVAHV